MPNETVQATPFALSRIHSNVPQKMKILLLLTTASFFLCSLSLAGDKNKFPDLTKAFPKEKLISQSEISGIRSYAYASDLNYLELQAAFLKFLGEGWIEVPVDPKTKKMANEGLEGNVLFSNPDFKDTQIGLTQMKMPVEGKKYLVSIVVMKIRAGQVVAPEGE